jgi:hypothetical protein
VLRIIRPERVKRNRVELSDKEVIRAKEQGKVRENPSPVSPSTSLRAGSFTKGDANTPKKRTVKWGFPLEFIPFTVNRSG